MSETPEYRIGQAAVLSGVSAANIRFYEKEGLLPEQAREANGYRGYGEADLHQLRFIRLCRAMDMSLDEVRALLNLRAGDRTDCAHADETLAAHIAHVRERLNELRALEKDLLSLRERCDGLGPNCRIIEALHERAERLPAEDPAGAGKHRRVHHRHV